MTVVRPERCEMQVHSVVPGWGREDLLQPLDDGRHAAGRGQAESTGPGGRLAHVGLGDLHRHDASGVLVRAIDATAHEQHRVFGEQRAGCGVRLREDHDLHRAVEVLEA